MDEFLQLEKIVENSDRFLPSLEDHHKEHILKQEIAVRSLLSVDELAHVEKLNRSAMDHNVSEFLIALQQWVDSEYFNPTTWGKINSHTRSCIRKCLTPSAIAFLGDRWGLNKPVEF